MDEEKQSVEKRSGSASESLVPPLATPEEERRLIKKIDLRILPITCLLYLCACEFSLQGQDYPWLFLPLSLTIDLDLDLDRTNLGNARLQGLPQETLHGDPTGILFNWVNSAFYFSYVSKIMRPFLFLRVLHLNQYECRFLTLFHFCEHVTDPLPNPCNGLF